MGGVDEDRDGTFGRGEEGEGVEKGEAARGGEGAGEGTVGMMGEILEVEVEVEVDICSIRNININAKKPWVKCPNLIIIIIIIINNK